MALPSVMTVGGAVVVLGAAAGIAAWAFGAQADTPSASISLPPGTSQTQHTGQHSGHPNNHRSKTDHTSRDQAVPDTLVEVYNNSGVSGLASQTARTLERAGWNVAATDNWYGDIPSSTVYFPPSYRHDARRLATALHITRLHHAVSPMSFDRLTVILTSR